MEVFMFSVAKKSGYTEAFKWLSNYLKWFKSIISSNFILLLLIFFSCIESTDEI